MVFPFDRTPADAVVAIAKDLNSQLLVFLHSRRRKKQKREEWMTWAGNNNQKSWVTFPITAQHAIASFCDCDKFNSISPFPVAAKGENRNNRTPFGSLVTSTALISIASFVSSHCSNLNEWQFIALASGNKKTTWRWIRKGHGEWRLGDKSSKVNKTTRRVFKWKCRIDSGWGKTFFFSSTEKFFLYLLLQFFLLAPNGNKNDTCRRLWKWVRLLSLPPHVEHDDRKLFLSQRLIEHSSW